MYDARFSGVLLAVSSLPGPYGIGSLGAPARRFVDFLAEAGQTYWQILPLVPPGHGNSPYMSPSAFAGNPFLIDLDELAAEGLLTQQELDSARREARAAGCKTCDGLGMLLCQGAEAFRLYSGLEMPVEEIRALLYT